jgi:hypothetical protein
VAAARVLAVAVSELRRLGANEAAELAAAVRRDAHPEGPPGRQPQANVPTPGPLPSGDAACVPV